MLKAILSPAVNQSLRSTAPRFGQTKWIPQVAYVPHLQDAENQPAFLDFRAASLFARGFIPGSVNVSSPDCLRLFSRLPESANQGFYVIPASAVHRHAARSSLGAHRTIRVKGWLRPGVIRQWSRDCGPLASFDEIDADALAADLTSRKTFMLDLRDEQSFLQGHIPDSLHMPLAGLAESIAGMAKETRFLLICESGDRAGYAASLLSKLGYSKIAILRGGYQAYVARALPGQRDLLTIR